MFISLAIASFDIKVTWSPWWACSHNFILVHCEVWFPLWFYFREWAAHAECGMSNAFQCNVENMSIFHTLISHCPVLIQWSMQEWRREALKPFSWKCLHKWRRSIQQHFGNASFCWTMSSNFTIVQDSSTWINPTRKSLKIVISVRAPFPPLSF